MATINANFILEKTKNIKNEIETSVQQFLLEIVKADKYSGSLIVQINNPIINLVSGNFTEEKEHPTNKKKVRNKTKESFGFKAFISHASEDKASVVLPLSELLIDNGLKIWLDKREIDINDSFKDKIDEGLKDSEFAILVISKDFFEKKWPKYEFEKILNIEFESGIKRVLPIWHRISKDEILTYCPFLLERDKERKTLKTSDLTIAEIAKELTKFLGKRKRKK